MLHNNFYSYYNLTYSGKFVRDYKKFRFNENQSYVSSKLSLYYISNKMILN